MPTPLRESVPVAISTWLEENEDVGGGEETSATKAGDDFFKLKTATDDTGLAGGAADFLGVNNEDILHASWPKHIISLATRIVDGYERDFDDEEVLGPDSKGGPGLREFGEHCAAIIKLSDELCHATKGYRSAVAVIRQVRWKRHGRPMDEKVMAAAKGKVHDGLLRYAQRIALVGVEMRTDVPTPSEPRNVEAHSSITAVVAVGYLELYKVASKVGEVLMLSAACDEYLQDVYCSPLAACAKTDTATGLLTGEYRLITDALSDKGGRPGPNSFMDKTRFPPTVNPTHEDVCLMIRWEAFMWPGLPIVQSKRDAVKAFQQLVYQLARVNLACTRLPSLIPDQPQDFPPVTVIQSSMVFGSTTSPSNWGVVSALAVALMRTSGPHPEDILLAPAAAMTCSMFVDDAFDATAGLGGGARPVYNVRAIEAAMHCIVQGRDGQILNQRKMATEGHAAYEHRCWGTTSSTAGMEFDRYRGYFEYPPDKCEKFLRMLLARPGLAGAREVASLDHLRLQGVTLQVARLSTAAKTALPGLYQMCKHARGAYLNPVGSAAVVQRAWAEYDESKALLLWVAREAIAHPETLRRSFYAFLPPEFELRAADAPADLIRWTNMDANGFEETGAAGVVTATDWSSKSSIVFRGAEVVELLRAHLLGADKGFIIFVLEMLAVVGLATVTASLWQDKVVVFITDNDNVKCAINSKTSGNPYVRYLLRILAALADVFNFRYHVVYIWTKNNKVEDGAGRNANMLAAKTDAELQAAARDW